jgi:tRNA G18 (ribose-2'-O)-methylase SpoU
VIAAPRMRWLYHAPLWAPTLRYPGRVSLPTIAIDDAGDPRIAEYRNIKDRPLAAASGRFVAESERVVRRLIDSPLRVASVLLTAPRLATLADALGGPFPVYLASQEVLDRVAGFHVHRGCLAIGERPPPAELPPDARAVVVLEDLTDVDNLGAIARHAAAFGADALVLSPRCADPFYRKAIRVSLGGVFRLPIVRPERWPEALVELRARGLTLIAAVLDDAATPLAAVRPPGRFALLLGAEGPGLSLAARKLADREVTIPMSPGADSLNVATAAAVFLYQLTRSSDPSQPI